MLAVIPARGGSKGLPGKNIKVLAGKPLIAYSIIAARKSKFIDQIIVSTDSQEIAAVALKYKAKVPFMRPPQLAQDDTPLIDVLIYTIDKLNKQSASKIEDFIVLLPTAPLRATIDIDSAINVFLSKKANSVVAVTQAPSPPSWNRVINKEGKLEPPSTKDRLSLNKNRQELETVFRPNAMFVLKYSALKKYQNYYSSKTFPCIIPKERSIDIDDQLDFDIAEFLISKNEKKV